MAHDVVARGWTRIRTVALAALTAALLTIAAAQIFPSVTDLALAAPACPPGTSLVAGKCLPPCAAGQLRNAAGACVAPPPAAKAPTLAPTKAPTHATTKAPPTTTIKPAQVVCRSDQMVQNGACVPRPACEPGLIRNANGICVAGPNACAAGAERDASGKCVVKRDPNAPVTTLACPVGQHQEGRNCVPNAAPAAKQKSAPATAACDPNFQIRNPDGTCQTCGVSSEPYNGQCHDKCPNFGVRVNGVCQARPTTVKCGFGQALQRGITADKDTCITVNTCAIPGMHRGANDKCEPDTPIAKCDPSAVLVNGVCTCPAGTTKQSGSGGPLCVIACPVGRQPSPDGRTCVTATPTCSGGMVTKGGQCVCPSGTNTGPNGDCIKACPPGTQLDRTSNLCVAFKTSCPDGQTLQNGACYNVTCNGGSTLVNGACTCPAGTNMQRTGGGIQCVIACPDGRQPSLDGKSCIVATPTCSGGMVVNDGRCSCPAGTRAGANGECTRNCPDGQQNDLGTGQCVAIKTSCPAGQTLQNGYCYNVTCTGGSQLVSGVCTCPGGGRPDASGACPPANTKGLPRPTKQ